MYTHSNERNEWYSIHVPAGLPTRIARAAHRRGMTPGEFLAHAVGLVALKPSPSSFRITALPARTPELELGELVRT